MTRVTFGVSASPYLRCQGLCSRRLQTMVRVTPRIPTTYDLHSFYVDDFLGGARHSPGSCGPLQSNSEQFLLQGQLQSLCKWRSSSLCSLARRFLPIYRKSSTLVKTATSTPTHLLNPKHWVSNGIQQGKTPCHPQLMCLLPTGLQREA